MEKLVICMKIGLDLYVKGKWHPKDSVIPVPEKGLPYFCCNMITSRVAEFESYRDGYRIRTQNSTYLFYSDTIESVEDFAKDNGLPEKSIHSSGSVYWYNDIGPNFR